MRTALVFQGQQTKPLSLYSSMSLLQLFLSLLFTLKDGLFSNAVSNE